MFSPTAAGDRLISAIVAHEGWHAVGSSSAPTGSRSYRHHNPGNLRASPYASEVVDGFAIFRSDIVGMFALAWDLQQKAKGHTSTGLGPSSTLRDLIYVYAPPEDGNDSAAYLQFVLLHSGISATTTLREIFSPNS